VDREGLILKRRSDSANYAWGSGSWVVGRKPPSGALFITHPARLGPVSKFSAKQSANTAEFWRLVKLSISAALTSRKNRVALMKIGNQSAKMAPPQGLTVADAYCSSTAAINNF